MHDLLSAFDIVNFIAAVFGIVTGIIALILSLVFFFSAKSSERRSENAMTEIKMSTEALQKLSMRMLDRVTKAIITPSSTENKLIELLKSSSTPVADAEQENPERPDSKTLNQWRVDNAIISAFYAAAANLSAQSILQLNQGIDDKTSNLYPSLNTSKQEYGSYIEIVETSGLLKSSPFKERYDSAKSVESKVLNQKEFTDSQRP